MPSRQKFAFGKALCSSMFFRAPAVRVGCLASRCCKAPASAAERRLGAWIGRNGRFDAPTGRFGTALLELSTVGLRGPVACAGCLPRQSSRTPGCRDRRGPACVGRRCKHGALSLRRYAVFDDGRKPLSWARLSDRAGSHTTTDASFLFPSKCHCALGRPARKAVPPKRCMWEVAQHGTLRLRSRAK